MLSIVWLIRFPRRRTVIAYFFRESSEMTKILDIGPNTFVYASSDLSTERQCLGCFLKKNSGVKERSFTTYKSLLRQKDKRGMIV